MNALEATRLEVADGVAKLTLVDAARNNPVDGRLCRELNAVSLEVSVRNDVRAVLLSAEGRMFSCGGDIDTFLQAPVDLPRAILQWTADLNAAITRLQRMRAPIVAVVDGVCAGGAAALVAGADLVVASTRARFVAAYAGIGFSCDAGASVTLTRRMGLGRARRFLLMNETLDASAALAAGLVDEIASPEEVGSRGGEIAARLAAGPTRAFGEMRRLLLSAGETPMEVQLELEAQALARTAGTPDAIEGLRAFREKRPPVFSGQ